MITNNLILKTQIDEGTNLSTIIETLTELQKEMEKIHADVKTAFKTEIILSTNNGGENERSIEK